MTEYSIIAVRPEHLLSALSEAAEALEAAIPPGVDARFAAAARLRAVARHVLEECPPLRESARRICRTAPRSSFARLRARRRRRRTTR